MDILGQFREWLASWGASESTITHRLVVIEAGLREWGPLESVTTETLQRWLARGDWSGWTRVTYYGHLRSFFGWLAESGRIEADPTAGLRRPRQPPSHPRPLTDREVEAVLAAATGHLRMWVLLGLLAGLRAHEIAKTRGEDVTASSIYVVGKGNKPAEVPTHPDVWSYAVEHYPARGWWFPSPRFGGGSIGAPTVTQAVTRLFASLEIEGSCHRLRHTFATRLLRGGVSVRVVQTLMRHESLATTAGYLAVDEDERVAAVRALAA